MTRALALLVAVAAPAAAQVDQERAAGYFREVAAICEKDGGRLWGVSLCGPLALVDAQTKTIATNQRAPNVPQPGFMGYANTAVDWGGTLWSTVVWRMIPSDPHGRARLIFHELPTTARKVITTPRL